MGETYAKLWGFVYTESQVTLQAKADSQKVNYIRLSNSCAPDLLQYEILYFLHSLICN